jgi:hypothetical protein
MDHGGERTTVAATAAPGDGLLAGDRASVELQGVTKRFGDFTAVREFDLAFGRGEFHSARAERVRQDDDVAHGGRVRGPDRGADPDRRRRRRGPAAVSPSDWGAARLAVPPQINILATMIFVATLVLMLFTVLQQRRAERMAAVRPEPA